MNNIQERVYYLPNSDFYCRRQANDMATAVDQHDKDYHVYAVKVEDETSTSPARYRLAIHARKDISAQRRNTIQSRLRAIQSYLQVSSIDVS